MKGQSFSNKPWSVQLISVVNVWVLFSVIIFMAHFPIRADNLNAISINSAESNSVLPSTKNILLEDEEQLSSLSLENDNTHQADALP